MRAIVDTNVLKVANGEHARASAACAQNASVRLTALQAGGRIVLDDRWRILKEYGQQIDPNRPQSAGSVFYKWALNNYANSQRCEWYALTPQPDEPGSFAEFPSDPALTKFDLPDRKFIALAVVAQAPVWNAVDSDYWNCREALMANGIIIEWICSDYFHPSD